MPTILSEQYPWKVPTIQGYSFSSLTQRQENNWNTAKWKFELYEIQHKGRKHKACHLVGSYPPLLPIKW